MLACDPSVLVLDEPSANLDPRGRRRLIQLIERLPCTKLIATHDLEMVLELCPRTVLLDAGRVVADGPSRDILGDLVLIEAHGLEQPLSLKFGSPVTGSMTLDIRPSCRLPLATFSISCRFNKLNLVANLAD